MPPQRIVSAEVIFLSFPGYHMKVAIEKTGSELLPGSLGKGAKATGRILSVATNKLRKGQSRPPPREWVSVVGHPGPWELLSSDPNIFCNLRYVNLPRTSAMRRNMKTSRKGRGCFAIRPGRICRLIASVYSYSPFFSFSFFCL